MRILPIGRLLHSIVLIFLSLPLPETCKSRRFLRSRVTMKTLYKLLQHLRRAYM